MMSLPSSVTATLTGGLRVVLCAGVLAASALVGPGQVERAAAADMKIGWVDAQRVLDETAAGKDIRKRVEAFRDSRQVVIDLEEKELKEFEAKLEKQMPLLSEEARREKQIAFKTKFDRYQKQVVQLSRELQDKQTELLEEFGGILDTAIEQVAKKGGYTMVFDKRPDGGLLYGVADLEITKQVIARVDASHP